MVEAMRISSMESMSSSTSSPPYKISSKSTNEFKSCTHQRSLNVRHFEMVEVTGFNSMESRSSSMSSQIHQLVQKLCPPQNFKCLPFWNGWSYEIKKM
jgi:hypothetical protein